MKRNLSNTSAVLSSGMKAKRFAPRSLFLKSLCAGLFVAVVGPAAAATVFDFANNGFVPTNGVDCTGGDRCSSNVNSVLSGALSFQSGGITVDAFASYNASAFGVNAAVVQDYEGAYNGQLSGSTAIGAGLGVYHSLNNNADDNITAGEAIQLHFNQAVALSSVGLRADGHNTTGWSPNATFQYSFDNSTWATAALPVNNGQFALAQTGQDFYFRYGGGNANQFYVSSMSVSAVTPVPEPETYAMLLAGLGLMGFTVRRRRQAAASI